MWLGNRNGKKDKESAVKSGAQSVATELMDITIQQKILHDTTRTADATEALVSFCAEWKEEQDEAKKEERMDRVETNQHRIFGLLDDVLKRMDKAEDAATERRAKRLT